MHIRRYLEYAGVLAALFDFTMADASAQPLAGTRLGPITMAGTLGHSDTVAPIPVDLYIQFRFGHPRYYPRYRYRRYSHRRYRRSGRREGRSCSYWSRRCIANWGYNNSNYRGCLRYYSCY